MPEEDIQCTSRENLMTPVEIETLTHLFVQQGVTKIRLTGGEPLVRKEAGEIIERLSALPVQLTLTTNGLLLEQFLPVIQKAGIHSLNISLDTLQTDVFKQITRRSGLEKVLANIDLLLKQKVHVKINMVVMRGINDGEINDFVRWSTDKPVHVRFIEFMPFSGNSWEADRVFPMDEILRRIQTEFEPVSLGREPQGTANKFFIRGARGTFAFISTMSQPFCGDCNRLRLTADGKLKNCLFSTDETDLLGPLRAGADVLPLILDNVAAKKEKLGGQFDETWESLNADALENRSMIRIGG